MVQKRKFEDSKESAVLLSFLVRRPPSSRRDSG
jgi:hypothetical protein